MKYTLLLWFCCCLTVTLQAQSEEEDSLVLVLQAQVAEEDSAETTFTITDEGHGDKTVAPESLSTSSSYRDGKVEVRKFDDASWRKVVGSTNFEEKAEEEKVEETQLRDRTAWAPWTGTFLRVISYVIMIGIGLLIIYYVLRNTRIEAMPVKKTVREDISKPVENIEEFEISRALQTAIEQGDFRLAVRIYYLGLLKNLNEGGKIEWKKDKTNLDYLAELFTKSYLYPEIRAVTVLYERVWYGERRVTSESFAWITTEFESLDQKMKTKPE